MVSICLLNICSSHLLTNCFSSLWCPSPYSLLLSAGWFMNLNCLTAWKSYFYGAVICTLLNFSPVNPFYDNSIIRQAKNIERKKKNCPCIGKSEFMLLRLSFEWMRPTTPSRTIHPFTWRKLVIGISYIYKIALEHYLD